MTKISFWLKRLLLPFFLILFVFVAYSVMRVITPATPEVYKIGMDSTWYPLTLYGKEHGLTAFATDLLFSIARDQKIKVEIARLGHKRLLDLLEDGHVDGVLSSILPDKKTESEFYFSNPFYKYGAVLVMRKDSSFETVLKLPEKRIGIKRNSAVLYRLTLDPTVSFVPYDSPLAALEDLIHDRVDGVIFDQLLLYLYYGGLYQNQLKVVTSPLTQEGLRLVVLQGGYQEELITKFNAGLENLKQNGTYQKLLDKWEIYNP